jgi:hypothetical protein
MRQLRSEAASKRISNREVVNTLLSVAHKALNAEAAIAKRVKLSRFNMEVQMICRDDIKNASSSSPSSSLSPADLTTINSLGIDSGLAQFLNGPITSVDKLKSEETLYLARRRSKRDDDDSSTNANNDEKNSSSKQQRGEILGYLKMGPRHLYLYNTKGKMSDSTIICCLDFYIDERLQRGGMGKALFDAMLLSMSNREGAESSSAVPGNIAYDRPSPKLPAFLAKHYSLGVNGSVAVEQPNKFLVFDAIFR